MFVRMCVCLVRMRLSVCRGGGGGSVADYISRIASVVRLECRHAGSRGGWELSPAFFFSFCIYNQFNVCFKAFFQLL